MPELAPDQLWYPGQNFSLSAEYPVPSTEELTELWHDYTDSGAVIPSPGVYGVLAEPQASPSAFASVDLCEVVRHTHTGLRLVEEPVAGLLPDIHDYCSGLSIYNGPDITAVAQVLMHAGLIEPIEDIDTVTTMLQRWRKAGVYVIANTSTLPGCEASTINFMATHMPQAFDGLLLPRNHDSSLPLTKGVAAALTMGHVSTAELIKVAHIDDKPVHNTAFRLAFGDRPDVQLATFQPYYPSSYEPDPHSHVTPDPVSAFEAAEAFLLSQD